MGVINNQDWPVLKEKFLQASPFPSICIDNFLSPEFALELSRSYPKYSNVQNQGMEFSTVNQKLKVQVAEPEKFPGPVNKLYEALASDEFIMSMQTLSGIDEFSFDNNFAGGGTHITNSSGILDVHVDFNLSKILPLYRRLNILIYLNEEWQEGWGGNLKLWDKELKNCVHSFSPILNRCLIFSTSDYSFRGVTALTIPPGTDRKSFPYNCTIKSRAQTFMANLTLLFLKFAQLSILRSNVKCPLKPALKNWPIPFIVAINKCADSKLNCL